MFCNQSRFDLPTAIVTAAIFNNLVDSAQTKWLTKEHRKLREALPSILEGDSELLTQWANDENFIKFCQGQEASRKKAAGGKTKGEVFKALTIEKKLQTYCDNLKKSLPFVIFIATYIESASASGKMGCWRKQAACRLNGLCVIDFDHVDEGAAGLLPLSSCVPSVASQQSWSGGSQRGSDQPQNLRLFRANQEDDQTTPNPSYSGGEIE